MRRVGILFALLLCSRAVVAGAQQPTAGADGVPILAIEDIGRGAVPINGQWQFHLGDDPHWAALAAMTTHREHISAARRNLLWRMTSPFVYRIRLIYRRYLDIPPSCFRIRSSRFRCRRPRCMSSSGMESQSDTRANLRRMRSGISRGVSRFPCPFQQRA